MLENNGLFYFGIFTIYRLTLMLRSVKGAYLDCTDIKKLVLLKWHLRNSKVNLLK